MYKAGFKPGPPGPQKLNDPFKYRPLDRSTSADPLMATNLCFVSFGILDAMKKYQVGALIKALRPWPLKIKENMQYYLEELAELLASMLLGSEIQV